MALSALHFLRPRRPFTGVGVLVALVILLCPGLGGASSKPRCAALLEGASRAVDAGQLLDAAIELESELEAFKAEVFAKAGAEMARKLELVASDEERLNALMEEIGAEDNGERVAEALRELSLSIDQQRQQLRSVNPQQPARAELETAFWADDIRDFESIVPAQLYVYRSSKEGYALEFSPKVLKEITKKGLSLEAKNDLLAAIHTGLVNAQGLRGIKFAKTYEGIHFVEVKSYKFPLRIYGCIEGRKMSLEFVGTHMINSNDPQLERIRTLCR